MDNAARWARQRVAVSARREGDRLPLRIDDDGTGLGDTRAILQIHVRGDERVPGHGVGLAGGEDLVASHGRELTLARSDMGGGRVEIVLRTA
jgi:Signal transduction histidine kinase